MLETGCVLTIQNRVRVNRRLAHIVIGYLTCDLCAAPLEGSGDISIILDQLLATVSHDIGQPFKSGVLLIASNLIGVSAIYRW